MFRIVLFTVLLFLLTLPVYAGHGTIKETDTEIIVEYSGDGVDKQVTKAVVEERQNEEKQKQIIVESKKVISSLRDARRAERRKDEE